MAKTRACKRTLTRNLRVSERAALGNLRNLRLSIALKKKYSVAVKRFFDFLREHGFETPSEADLLDERLCNFLESLWEEGHPKTWASDCLSGLAKLCPYAKGSFPLAWTYFDTWRKHELPERAAPVSLALLKALAAYSLIVDKNFEFSLSMIVSFHCLLRIGECLGLKAGDVVFGSSTAMLNLGYTKGGKRRGEKEFVEASDSVVIQCLHWLCEGKDPGEQLFTLKYQSFRSELQLLLGNFQLNNFNFKSHSFRRGGTTYEFADHGSYDVICQRGRNARTARLYISEAVEMHQALAYSKKTVSMLKRHGRAFESFFG